MSLCLDLPDDEYQWIQFSGAWGRERHVKTRMLRLILRLHIGGRQPFKLWLPLIDLVGYILKIRDPAAVYFGKKVALREDYGYLIENRYRPVSAYVYDDEYSFSLEHLKQEYPSSSWRL